MTFYVFKTTKWQTLSEKWFILSIPAPPWKRYVILVILSPCVMLCYLYWLKCNSEGLALGYSRLSCRLQWQHCIWVPVWVLDAPLPVQLTVIHMGKQWKMARVLGPLPPWWETRWNSRLLPWPGPALTVVAIWRMNQQIQDISLSLSLFL